MKEILLRVQLSKIKLSVIPDRKSTTRSHNNNFATNTNNIIHKNDNNIENNTLNITWSKSQNDQVRNNGHIYIIIIKNGFRRNSDHKYDNEPKYIVTV